MAASVISLPVPAADDLSGDMIRTSRAIAEEIGGLVGFAIVAWGRDGDLRSAYQIDNGPISAALLPTLVGDALNRHVSLEMAPATKLTGPR